MNTVLEEGISPVAKWKVLIVEDHPIFRDGVKHLINSQPGFEVCGDADTMPAALGAIEQLQPDLLLTDISLKGNNGIELIKAVKARFPNLPILVLSVHEESLFAERALRAGARGYVMKQEPPEIVLTAIHKVLSGDIYLSPVMNSVLIGKLLSGADVAKASPVSGLSDRELEVLQMIGRGFGTRRIADELHLSVKTVECHRLRIKQKLQIKTAPELIRFAVEWLNGKY